jgi:hypothetical protein
VENVLVRVRVVSSGYSNLLFFEIYDIIFIVKRKEKQNEDYGYDKL